MDYTHATIEDIIRHAKANDNVEELKRMATKKVGKRNITFFELRKMYFQKFMPDAIPVAKPKKPNFYQMIKDL